MSFVKTKDGIEIFYKDWGKGQPIVFSHGWPLSSDDWDAQMLFFLNQGYRVIAHDRRGHGRSSQVADGHDMDHYADDLAAVTAHLDLKNVIHVGHSTGGGEVVHYLARHGESRVSKAAIISAVPPLMVQTTANPKGLPARLERDRNGEMATHRHAAPARTGLHLAKWFSLGIYSHKEMTDSVSLAAALGQERRAERQIRFLETVAQSSPQPEVVWNIAEVRRAVTELIATGVPPRSTQVVSRIMQQTSDAEVRDLCVRALASAGVAAGQ